MTEQQKQEIQDKFLAVLSNRRALGSISAACDEAKISRQTIYRWRNSDSDFDSYVVAAIEDAKDRFGDIAENALLKRVESGDTTAIIFALKKMRPEYYGEADMRHLPERYASLPKNPLERFMATGILT